MTSIRILGCSHTQGISHLKRPGSNWVYYYRDKVDRSIPIYSYAQAGSSVIWHSFVLSLLKKRYPDDIYITQIANPGRYAWWDEDINEENLVERCYATYNLSENLTEYNIYPDAPANVKWFNTGAVYSITPEKQTMTLDTLKFAKMYYDRANIIHHWAMFAYYLANNSNYCFFHKNEDERRYVMNISSDINYDTSEHYIGADQFRQYIIDDGKHLSDDGNRQVAQMVFDGTNRILK